MNRLRALSEISDSLCRAIDTVLFDIDDTFTTAGRIGESAYRALWQGHQHGLRLIPVTGRPAGWCDHIARMWPVDAVVGENGALAFAMIEGTIRRLFAERPSDASERLERIKQQVLTEVPGCKVAADQPYRLYDLAIDFAEEVGPLSRQAVVRIAEIFAEHGATAKISSIHVNGWYGDYDKLSMCRRLFDQLIGEPLDIQAATFIGDSPNDEPMFAYFPHAVGVANLRDTADLLEALPTYITDGAGGDGFAELIEKLCSARDSSS
ncbi:MAG: HAD family phosphatase [Deltaproteobacteria bacterium]|nr:HAD family phosphatase [Deltaproteobacteria bacterium]